MLTHRLYDTRFPGCGDEGGFAESERPALSHLIVAGERCSLYIS